MDFNMLRNNQICKHMIWIVLIVLSTVSFGSTNKESNSSSKPVNYLYEVSLNDSIEVGKIVRKYKKKLIFKTNKFKSNVKRYDIFLILNEEKSGVIAEIVVTRVKKKRKKAYAKINRVAPSFRLSHLVGKPLVKMEDLRHIMGNTRIFAENPIVSIRYIQTSLIAFSVNQITESHPNHVVYSSGANLEFFLPRFSQMEWLNWFGLSYQLEHIADTKKFLRLPEIKKTDEAIFSSNRQNISLLFQPIFREMWVRRIFMRLGADNLHKDKLAIIGNDEGTKKKYRIKIEFKDLELGFMINPVFNIFAGLSWNSSFNGTMAQKYFSGGESPVFDEIGNYSYSKISIIMQIFQPIYPTLRIDARVFFDRIFEKFIPDNRGSDFSGANIVDWRFSMIFGVSWSP